MQRGWIGRSGVFWVLALCLGSGSPASGEARYEPGPCPERVRPRDARCGTLLVPEVRGRSDEGRTLRLAVAVLPATGTAPEPDPVIYLHGGPGGSALDGAHFWARNRIREKRDLILLDQRGVGASEPVLCPDLAERDLEALAADLTPEDELATRLEAHLDCRRTLLAEGIDLGAYHSDASAADVADLRRALGIEAWNLYGISYGTKLALTILRDHPEGVRSVVLDSVYPPGVRSLETRVEDLARALDVLAERCLEQDACRERFGDVRTRLREAARALEERPLAVPAPSLPVEADTFFVNAQDLVVTVHQLLYRRAALAAIPILIELSMQGDPAAFAGFIDAMAPRAMAVNRAAYTTVECFERGPFASREGLAERARAHPELARWLAFFDLDLMLCPGWADQHAPPEEFRTVESDVPTLLLTGEYDPITPPAWGRVALAGLARGVHHTFPGVGHAASLSHPCPGRVVRDFLDDPDAPPDLSCTASMSQPEFVTAVSLSPGVYHFARDVLQAERPALLGGFVAVGVLLAAGAVGLPLLGIFRRLRGVPVPRSVRLSRGSAALAATAAVAFWAGLAGAIGAAAEQSELVVAFGLPSRFAWVFAIGWVALALSLLAMAAAGPGLRRERAPGRVHLLAVLAGLLGSAVLWLVLGV